MQKEVLDRMISRYLHEFVVDDKQQQSKLIVSLKKLVCEKKEEEVNQVINPPQGFTMESSDCYLAYLAYDESSYTNEGLPFYRLCLSNAVINEFLQDRVFDLQTQFSSILEAAIEMIGRIWLYCNQNPENEQANQLLLNHKKCLTDWLYSIVLQNDSDQGTTALSAADTENEIK